MDAVMVDFTAGLAKGNAERNAPGPKPFEPDYVEIEKMDDHLGGDD